MDQAISIEKSYQELYTVTIAFNEAQVQFGHEHGYVELAFGLRLRTPILAASVINSSKTPYAVKAEGRSAVNAVTQSWGMLINRAIIHTNNDIEQSVSVYDILPINAIHDALYFIVREDVKTIKFLNDRLIHHMEWNDHPKIKSKKVPMKADLELGRSWDKMKTLKNKATEAEITTFLLEEIS